ncbi:uncharacterized protein RCO7_05337 [Rhynchosporium graminicola]|uniref:Uncharacterized protein n=1 Tax=Rhynchosporium graminicola TaxID=2792576 RepID=A0A1E1L413_9HELO|nr:uncharacterized protein RCO7_05337 [Rhynchosporium commune]
MALRKAQHKALHFSVEGANDNTWGYGQTTAVFLWAPFLLDAIREKIAHNNKLRADIVAESAIELDDLQGRSAEQPWTSSDALTTDTEIYRRGSAVYIKQTAQQDRYAADYAETFVSCVMRRDTEARIEGRDGIRKQSMVRAATWQDGHLNVMPAAHI